VSSKIKTPSSVSISLNELIFDESISQENRKHLADINQKTKTQLTNLTNVTPPNDISIKIVGYENTWNT
jgi:hypothetical protein